MSKLAINGGHKIRNKLFPPQETTNRTEALAVYNLIRKGILSEFRGNYSENFYGGKWVKNFEYDFADKFGHGDYKKAVSVNSCTSALQIACGSLYIESGEEVIVTPWSMSCSATAPLLYDGVPVFADIEKDYFCLDPDSVKEKITDKTVGIIAVDLFGQPFSKEINKIAEENGLWIIEDAAQAIGAKRENNYCGTLGNIGCFSFTQGKHITAGEGGILLTDSKMKYNNLTLLRNHAEAVISDKDGQEIMDISFLKDAYGFNMRMTEIQALILCHQLKKLDRFIFRRIENAKRLNYFLDQIPAITIPPTRKNSTHVYYALPFLFDDEVAGVSRDKFIAAVKAELTEEENRLDKGIPIGCGYIKPLYKMPLFQRKTSRVLEKYVCSYDPLPIVEDLWSKKLFLTLYHALPLESNDIRDICNAFVKVWENRGEIK